MGRLLPTAGVGYPVDQLGGQRSGGEIARPTGAGRPQSAGQVAPKLPDGNTSLFLFRFYGAAVHGLTHPAITGPSWSAQNFPCWPVLNDWFKAADLDSALARPGPRPTVTTGSFYGDSFVKPFLVVRAAMLARVPVWLDQSIWKIGGRGMRKVRASARTSFYPCRTRASDTTCNIRAECAGKPLLPTRPIFGDGHFVVARCLFGRVDLRS